MKFFLMLILLLASFTATAESVFVKEFRSENSESMEQFVVRIAPFIQQWTDENDAEICAFIGQNGSQFGVMLTTNHAKLECAMTLMHRDLEPSGFSVHSHIRATKVILSVNDTHYQNSGSRVKSKYTTISTKSFSENDFNEGNGYLIVLDHILVQTGRGTIKVIK